ncbi:MAG: hypothetical protein JSW65_01635 [Candidatus Bipolaricaulota bacterium]|nr:MAG: hypothetical protein JSW65_01635 [Candidatus Bipolaricaulota bacterium]
MARRISARRWSVGVAALSIVLAVPALAGAPEIEWIPIDRASRVETEAGALLVWHQANLGAADAEVVLHEVTISNLSFDPDGRGLVSLGIPVSLEALPSLEIVDLPAGWSVDASALAVGDLPSSAAPHWAHLVVGPDRADLITGVTSGIAVGDEATIRYRLPPSLADGVPYWQELARYGVLHAVHATANAATILAIPRIEEIAALAPSAVLDILPALATEEPLTRPLGAAVAPPAAVFPEHPPAAPRHPDLEVTIETERITCGALEDGENLWLRIPITVVNVGTMATLGRATVLVESPNGSHVLHAGPLDVGAGRELLLSLQALMGDPDPLDAARLLVIADPANELGESDERNNVAFTAIACTDRSTMKPILCDEAPIVRSPDLVLDAQSSYASCTADGTTGGCSVEIVASVRNDGEAWVNEGTILRVSSALGQWDAALGPIAPGAVHTVIVSYELSPPLPDAVDTGDLLFALSLDPEDTLPELDETNNETLLVLPCSECASR